MKILFLIFAFATMSFANEKAVKEKVDCSNSCYCEYIGGSIPSVELRVSNSDGTITNLNYWMVNSNVYPRAYTYEQAMTNCQNIRNVYKPCYEQ